MPNSQGRLYPHERFRIMRNRQAAIAKRKAILEKRQRDLLQIEWNRIDAQQKLRDRIEANRKAAIAKRHAILIAPSMKQEIARDAWLLTQEKKNFKPDEFPWISRKKHYWNLKYNAGYWRNEARKALYEHKPWSQFDYKYCMKKADLQDWKAQQIANNYNVFRRR